MLEQPRQQQDELIVQLQKHMAALEQENTLLKQRLTDLSELEQRYRLLANRDRIFEATISASNALLTIENFDEAVNTVLQIIGEKLDSDRVAVIENLDSPPEQLPRWKMLYEWHSPHTVPQISHPNVAQGSYEEIKEWYALFSQGEGVSCLLEEMPEPFRSGQAELNVKAFHIVPIFVEGKCWGVVGFDDCREAKRRSLDELAVLKTAAACIGSAIESDRTRQALLRAEQERATELEHINAELRQALDRLAESEEHFRTLFEYSSEGFNYVEFDPPYSVTLPIEEQCELYRKNLRVVKVNPAFAAMYGVENPDDLIGLKITDVHVEDSEKNAAFIRAIVENGYRGRNIETEEIDIYGQLRYFLNSGVITIKDGYVVNGWGTQVDITELRQTQQALLRAEQERTAQLERINAELRQALDQLAESEHRYRTLFELSNEGIYRFKYEPPVPVSAPIEDAIERVYRDFRYAEVNTTFVRQYSLENPDQIVGKAFTDFWVKGSEIGLETACKIIENGHQLRNALSEEIDIHGKRRYFLWNVVSDVRDGYVWGGWGMQTDITDLREAQQALLRAEQERTAQLEHINAELRQALDQLAESEERFRTLFELSNEGFYYTEIDPPLPVTLPIEEQCELIYRNVRVVKANPAFAAIYGVENPDELIGLRNADVHVPDSEKNTAFIRAQVENGYRIRNVETEEIDSQGRLRYFLNSGVATLKDGYVLGCWATQVDITELRETQQALLHAEQERAAALIKVNQELRQRDRLLSAVAQITKDLLETEDVELAIPAVLFAIGEAANISRVQLLLERQNPSTQKRQHFIAYEWVAEGIIPQINHPDMAVMDNDDFEVIVQELYAGRSIWQVVDNLPEPAKSQFESIEIKSTGTSPIFIEGRYIGCVVFDDCVVPRHWTQQEMDVLTAAAESIGAALHRKQLTERLIEERARAAEERATELESLNAALRRETLERCQAEEVIRSQNSALKHSLERLLQEPDIRGFLGALLDTLITQLQGHAANIWLLEDDRTTVTLWTAFALGQMHTNPEETLLPYEPIPVDLVAQTILSVKAGWQETIHYSGDDSRLPLPLQEFHTRDRLLSVLTTPLRLGYHLLGWLAFATQEDLQQMPSDKVAFLEAIAHQATLAIRLHHLAEEAKQAAIAREQEKAAQERAAELAKANHALRESLGSLATNPELDTFLGYLLLEMATQIDAVKNYLFLYDQATNTLALHTFVRDGKVFSKEANNFEPFAQPISADTLGVWGLMIQQKSPLNLALEQDNPSCWPGTYEWHRAQGHQEALCVPLILGEEPLGFLGLAFTEKAMLSPQDIELAQALAHQVTLAMQLTHLAEESRQTAILEERNRMAQEIHDTLAQAFAGIGMQLQAATRFRTTNPEKAQIHFDRAYALAQTGLTEARRSVWALSQEGLEYSDLAASVTGIAEQLTAGTSLQADIEVQGTPYSVEPEVGLNLLRIVQEAIANALRHAQAQTIQIQIIYEPTYVRLGVRDDGHGFDPQLPVKGFGLASMQQRVDHIGAQLLVSSQLGAGTEIAVILPMGE